MTCLTDYIGLRGCGSSAPASGLYINDLPGISLKQMVSLTNEEEKTYLDIWAIIQQRAQSRFSLDVREAMGKHYRMKSMLQGINMGGQVDITSIQGTQATPSSFNGFVIELTESASYEYVPSPLASIHVQQLNFYSFDIYNNVTFTIFDINTTQVLWSKVIDINQYWNTIEVNQTFSNNYTWNSVRLFCTFSNSVTDVYSLEPPYSHTIPGCCDVRVRGAYGNLSMPSDISFTSNTYGLSGIFSIVCSWDAVICQNKTLFSRAFWYLTGIELLTETLYSTKLNLFTTVNLQRIEKLREEYQVEYMKSLEQVAGGFDLSCDCCIECSGGVQLRETTSFY